MREENTLGTWPRCKGCKDEQFLCHDVYDIKSGRDVNKVGGGSFSSLERESEYMRTSEARFE